MSFSSLLRSTLPLFSVPSICNQWDWKGGRHQPERAWTRLVLKFHENLIKHSSGSGILKTKTVFSFFILCLKEPWLKKLWGQSFPKTSPSPSGSRLRCLSQTVSVVTQFILIRIQSLQLHGKCLRGLAGCLIQEHCGVTSETFSF